MKAPDVLVLGGGGLLGEIWMEAVLVGMQRSSATDMRECAEFIGTSAGSIVAAALAAGVDPQSRLGTLGREPSQTLPPVGAGEGPDVLRGIVSLGAAALEPLAALALGWEVTAAAGAMVRRALLSRVPTGRRSLAQLGEVVERLGVRFDGRLQIAALRLDSGRRVMFGGDGSPAANVAQAVTASCAIPGVYRPVRVGGHSYVDGGVWSPTNMDAANVSRGATVLCLNPTGSLRPSPRTPAGAFGVLSRSIATAEALALRRRGATVKIVNPDEASRKAMGINFFDARRRAKVAEAGVAQGHREGSALGGH